MSSSGETAEEKKANIDLGQDRSGGAHDARVEAADASASVDDNKPSSVASGGPVRRSSSMLLRTHAGPKKQVTFGGNLNQSSGSNNAVNKRKTLQRKSLPNVPILSGDEEILDHHRKRNQFKGPMRRRSYSFSEGRTSSSFQNQNKRWKRHKFFHSKSLLTKNSLPSKFLLGGNIRDPLNLNSLSDSKGMSSVTPESSPLPTPKHRKAEYKIEVLIPPNISDPLNLNSGVDENEYESQLLVSPGLNNSNRKKKFRYRKRFRNNSSHPHKSQQAQIKDDEHSGDSEGESSSKIPSFSADQEESVTKSEKEPATEPPTDQTETKERLDEKDSTISQKRPSSIDVAFSQPPKKVPKVVPESDIVSPVISQAAEKPDPKRRSNVSNNTTKGKNQNQRKSLRRKIKKKSEANQHPKKDQSKASNYTAPAKLPKHHRFEHGNYNRYYGYRNAGIGGCDTDIRFRYFKIDWFAGKDVLDIGCNVGQITMAIARDFGAKSVVGMDIDKNLIDAARKNLKYISSCVKPDGETLFPMNLPMKFGQLDPTTGLNGDPTTQSNSSRLGPEPPYTKFAENIKFVCGNYVLESDDLLELCQPEFDVIMCLSTTKWIHLNFGDDGIKRAFKRMYAQLRPGGLLILEAQDFSSYRKKKKLTEKIYENFKNIKLRPENFAYYLLHEVGFESGQTIAVPNHKAKGFQRPLEVFIKRSPFSSRTVSSHQNTPFQYRSPYLFDNPSAAHTPFYLSGPSPQMSGGGGRCYAPSLTPMYKSSPTYLSKSSARESPGQANDDGDSNDANLPGPSNQNRDQFSRPQDPPYPSPAHKDYFLGTTPNYSPGDTPSYPGYSGYTYGRSGITPGYSGPSPEATGYEPSPGNHSPVYTGPEPGTLSNASTPGHNLEENYSGPGYTPSYTPSNPGTPAYSPVHNQPSPGGAQNSSPPAYSPTQNQSPSYYSPSYSPHQSYSPGNSNQPSSSPLYSPGNATPKTGQGTPTAWASSPSPLAGFSSSTAAAGASVTSPQIQQPEVSGNTTPHPGPSSSSPQNTNPKYFWYGYSSSSGGGGGNTSGPSSPTVYPTHYSTEVGASSAAQQAESGQVEVSLQPSPSPSQPSSVDPADSEALDQNSETAESPSSQS